MTTRYLVWGTYDHVGNVSIRDSYHFTISPIYGKYTQNKNVALFPTVRDVRLRLGLRTVPVDELLNRLLND